MTAPKLSRQQTRVRKQARERTQPRLYYFSERQLAEAFAEWIRNIREPGYSVSPLNLGPERSARYLLALLAELASEYARGQ